MPNVWKRLTRPEAEPYQFPDAAKLEPKEPAAPAPPKEKSAGPEGAEESEPPSRASPLSYAQVQADEMERAAQREAGEILEQARQEAEEIRENARREGWEAGHAAGVRQGTEQAMEEGRRVREEQIQALSAEVERFLEQAGAALDRQLDENVDELRELAIAVAEKVVAVSLKSSSEVIGRMIQAAVDKRKRREWVRVHIAECDAKRMTRIPPALSAALASVSDQVRIIPMAGDEPGTCIVEMPDEIIDASASTQLNNIRSMLADIPADGTETPIGLAAGGAF